MVKKIEEPKTNILDEFTVAPLEVLKPIERELIIKPKLGEQWKNEQQAAYARVLNGYAYTNPKKFAAKQVKLLTQLKEIGEDPEEAKKYMTPATNLSVVTKGATLPE